MRKRTPAATLILLALVPSCSPIGSSGNPSAALPREIHGLDAEERVMNLNDYRGQVVLLDFWKTG